jgi:hypothetical protein
MVQSQLGQIIPKTLSQKKKTTNLQNKRAGGVVQGVGPEFKPQYCKKKKYNISYPFYEAKFISTIYSVIQQTSVKLLQCARCGWVNFSQDYVLGGGVT